MPTPTALPAAFTAGDVLTAANMNLLRGGFRILQVVEGTTSTQATTTSTTFVTTGLTATITPSSAGNKVLILVQLPFGKNNDSVFSSPSAKAFRGTVAGTALAQTLITTFIKDGNQFSQMANMMHLDSPSTTSAQIYTVGFAVGSGLDTAIVCQFSKPANILLLEVSA